MFGLFQIIIKNLQQIIVKACGARIWTHDLQNESLLA